MLPCQAEKFRSKAQKADTWRVPGQYCRYLFYLGTIRAIQLEYTEAKEVLQQASRKAPTCAHGFRVACNKWLILVRGVVWCGGWGAPAALVWCLQRLYCCNAPCALLC